MRKAQQRVAAPLQKRVPLQKSAILDLDRALADVFRIISAMRKENPVATYIKFPPLPSVFSESIVIAAAPVLFGPNWRGRFGGRVCDILLEANDGRGEKKVEVKATGNHAFQELKAKDLRADALVWIRFGRRFEIGSGPIDVVVLDRPNRYIKDPRRLDVNRFEAIPGVKDNQVVFHFESLEQLLDDTESESTPSA